MKRLQYSAAAVVAIFGLFIGAALVDAHDLFLRPRDYVVQPGSSVDVRVLNGSFATSEGAVTSDRLRDLSVIGPEAREQPDRSTWASAEKESRWRVSVKGPGTYLLAASLFPRTIRLTGKQFNDYLREEGLARVVATRTRQGIASDSAHERYAKHVKALVQVTGAGSSQSTSSDTAYRRVLGYPAEIVPLDDPYRTAVGGVLRVRALIDGKPLVNQPVLVGGRSVADRAVQERSLVSDPDGIVRVRLDRRGTWYVKFIDMRPVPSSAGDSVNYESRWATMTFARP